MSVHSFTEIHPMLFEIFQSGQVKRLICCWHYIKGQGITKVISIYPLCIYPLCTKFYGNPSRNCQDISLENKNVSLMVQIQENPGDHQTHEDSSSGDHECLQNLTAIHPILVESVLTNRHSRATTPPLLKTCFASEASPRY